MAYQDGKGTVSGESLLDLLTLCLSFLPRVFLVIDGLDECVTSSTFLRDCLSLTEATEVKILIFSRPNVACMRQNLKQVSVLAISREDLNDDISLYLEDEINILAERKLFPEGIDTSLLVDQLLDQADGMFLWARLMITYLQSPALTPRQRQGEIYRANLKGLDAMYRKILQLIQDADEPCQSLATKVFTWTAYCHRAMTASELHDATRDVRLESCASNTLLDMENAILMSCAGFIEKRSDNTIRFIHLTAKEFIVSYENCLYGCQRLVLPNNEAEAMIAAQCLQYLMFALPAQPLSKTIGERPNPENCHEMLPLIAYASYYWMAHTYDAFHLMASDAKSAEAIQLSILVERILKSPLTLMASLEALYTCSLDVALSTENLRWGQKNGGSASRHELASRNVIAELDDLGADLAQIDKKWGDVLNLDPGQLWEDVTAFTPSRFLAQTSALSVHEVKPAEDKDASLDGPPLFSISQTSKDFRWLAFLSVRPSR